jgi:hypothetical protein
VSKQTTIAAVLVYAAKLRADADAITRRDYWAKPYAPTDEAAKRLSQMCSKANVLALPPGATDEQLAEARGCGASDAMAILSMRFIDAQATYRSDKAAAEAKDNRLRNHHLRAQRDRQAARQKLTIGQRIDNALRELATVSGVSAANLESDLVSGSKEHGIQTDEEGNAFVDNPASKAKVIAERAMRQVEDELEDAKRRRRELELAA